MKTNNIVINSIMRKYIKHLCAILILLCTSASAWGATGAIDATGGVIILPSGSTSYYTSGDWTSAGAPSYSTSNDVINNLTISGTVVGSVKFYHAGGSGWLQLQSTNGYIETVISSTEGVDVVVYMKSQGASGTITAALTGATSQTVTGTTAAEKTLSTTSTSATLKITTASNAGQVGYIKIIPKAKFKVTFYNEYGASTPAAITQESGGAAITLPSAEPSAVCSAAGWVFAGWKDGGYQSSDASYVAGLIPAGSYTPTANKNFYAVFKKATGETLSTTYTCGSTSSAETPYEVSTAAGGFTIQLAQGNSAYWYKDAAPWRLYTDGSTLSIFGSNPITSLTIAHSGTYYGTFTSNVPGSTVTMASSSGGNTTVTNINANAITLTSGGSSQNRISSITVNYAGHTFNSNPSCVACTTLDTPENLAESNLTPTSVQLSWDAVSNASSYTVTIEGSSYEKVVNNITATSVTIDDLSEGCGAEYLWTVKAIGDGEDYCDSEESTTADFTTPTLSSIALSGTYPTDFAVGDAFSHEGQVVTATYSNGATKVVTGNCSWTGYNMSSGGDQTVTVSYTECTTPCTATYGIHLATYGNYVFTCAELTLEAYPETAGAPIFITSTANKKVRSQGYIQITGSGLTPSTTLTFPGLPATFEIKTATYGDLATDATGAIDVAAYIFYTPAADATSDGLDKITGITVTVGGAKTKTVNLTQDIVGRHLPEDFVIAAKNTTTNKWYALPANMSGTGNPEPIEIAVNDIDAPSVAYTAASNIYNLYVSSDKEKVQLGMKNNVNGNGKSFALWANNSDGSNDIGKNTGLAENELGDNYKWTLTQTAASVDDPQDAIFTISNPNNVNPLKAWFTASGGPKWGLYASGVEELRLIPASSVVFAEAEIVEWGQHGAIIEVDATAINATKVKAILNGDESSIVAASSTGTSVKGTATKYNYTAAFGDDIDFADAESNGAMLTLEWYNSSDVLVGVSNIIVPKIIAANGAMKSIMSGDAQWETEVHVLPGVTLEANAGDFESNDVMIKHLEIYPGATVVVTKGSQASGTLKVKTLVLRNGWKRIGGKAYDVARLYITPSTASMGKNASDDVWYSDWYIDFDQYYPIAVPWPVTVANMSYKNTSGAVSVGPSGTMRLRYYDGNSRATNVQTGVGDGANWKQYGEGENLPVPTTLAPSNGYAMTAKRPTGKAFSIIRMPMTIPSADWTTGGEKGEVSETHKDQVSVGAYGVKPESKTVYAEGWNFIANPYMSLYQGTITLTPAEGDATTINVVNIPDVDFKEYGQYATATTKLKPSSGFLIQTPKDGTITFRTANRQASAPSYRRDIREETEPEQQAYIVLHDEEAEDMMGIFVSDKYTADYDLNGDVEKLLSSGTSLRTYMTYGNMSLAYVALTEILAKEWIPVTVRIPATGEYTFSLHEASIAGELEGIYLIDYANNDKVTNLIDANYIFTAEAGTISNRFAINAVVGERKTPTSVDVVNDNSDKSKPIKFIYRDNVYIMHNGAIYDTTGKRVKGGQQ